MHGPYLVLLPAPGVAHAKQLDLAWFLAPRGGEKGAPGICCIQMCVNFQKFLKNCITIGHFHYTNFSEVADLYRMEDAYHQLRSG